MKSRMNNPASNPARLLAALALTVVMTRALPVMAADTIYSVPTPGTYTYPDANPIVLDSGDRFWFRGDTAGNYTLANDFTVNNGNINWSGGSATKVFFSGILTLNGNLTLSSDAHSPGRRADFTGDILLAGGNRTITSTTSSFASHAPTLFGTIDGSDIHSVTLKGPDTDRGMGIGGSGGWDVKNVTFDTGYIHLTASNASDDFFSGVRSNGGKVSLIGGTPVSIYKGTYDFNSDFAVTSGTITLRTSASDHEIILRNDLNLVTDGLTAMTWSGGSGKVSNNVTVGNGGILTLAEDNLKALAGDLTLLGGSRLSISYANGSPFNPRLVVETGKNLRLGDGSADTAETVAIRGLQTTAGDQNLIFRLSPASVIDDGNVTLRYETPAGGAGGRFIVAWTTPSADGVDLPFRGGSAGTVFAPDPSIGELVAVGPNSGPVFTASSPTSLITAGKVSFYRAPALGGLNNNRIQALSSLVVANGGSFVTAVAGGSVEASTVTVNDGGSLGGRGTFIATEVTLNAGAVLDVGNETLAGDLRLTHSATCNLTINGAATLFIDVFSNGAVAGVDYDRLSVKSALTGLSNLDLVVRFKQDKLDLADQTLTILTTSSDLTGQAFKSVTFENGYRGTVNYGNGFVSLTDVLQPPKGTVILMR